MKLRTCCLNIYCNPSVKIHAGKVRGFIGGKFKNHLLLHNHLDAVKNVYIYPRILYRTIQGMVKIIGIEEGIEEIYFLEKELDHFHLNDEFYEIIQKEIKYSEENFGINQDRCVYKFIDPWLALNSENYKEYKILSENEKKNKLLKILKGNIISVSKSFNYNVADELSGFSDFQEIQHNVLINGTRMASFSGMFAVNFDLPNYWGLGKSVSRGFGTVIRLNGQA
jgi:hypothetical protein